MKVTDILPGKPIFVPDKKPIVIIAMAVLKDKLYVATHDGVYVKVDDGAGEKLIPLKMERI